MRHIQRKQTQNKNYSEGENGKFIIVNNKTHREIIRFAVISATEARSKLFSNAAFG